MCSQPSKLTLVAAASSVRNLLANGVLESNQLVDTTEAGSREASGDAIVLRVAFAA